MTTSKFFPTGDEKHDPEGMPIPDQFKYIGDIIMNDIADGEQVKSLFGIGWLQKKYVMMGQPDFIKEQIERCMGAYDKRFKE